ncbi:MAG TPA: hypothetical protein VF902_06805 [Coriobacteriia bacterium]
MSDWQPPGAPAQPDYAPPQPDFASAGAPPPYSATPGTPPGAPAPKKRTGLIIAIVVIVLLLLCCCAVTVGGYLFFVLDSGSALKPGTSATGDPTSDVQRDPLASSELVDPEAAARAADWQKVRDAFVAAADAQYVAPDERQSRLAASSIGTLLPDFTIDEVKVSPGSYDAANHMYDFDGYAVLMHLTADPVVRMAFSYDVATAEADAAKLARDSLELEKDDDVLMIDGTTWVIFTTHSKAPLLHGIKDQSYVALLKLAGEQWPDGLAPQMIVQGDGSVVLSVETWDSFCFSDTYDRIEATYVRDGDGWKLSTYETVIEPKGSPSTDAPTATQI